MTDVGLVDTTFARIDMARFVLEELRGSDRSVKVSRYTVPGIKDIPVAAKRLLDRGCELVIALGMPGAADIDKDCANQASLGIIMVQIMTGKHIVEVFVHEDEADDEKRLHEIAEDRARKHARNALKLLSDPESLTRMAGTGQRQGGPSPGPIKP